MTAECWRERITRAGAYAWAGRIHEVLVPVGADRLVEANSLVVQHVGKGDDGQAGLERNVRLLRIALAEAAEPDPRTLFYLGHHLMELGELGEAAYHLHGYLEAAEFAEERYHAQLYLAQIEMLWQHPADAYRSALAALGEWPTWPQAPFALAEIDASRAQWRRVIAWCDLARSLPIPQSGLYLAPRALRADWIATYTEALIHCRLYGDALEWTRRALELLPNDRTHLRNLAFLQAAREGANFHADSAVAAAIAAAAAGGPGRDLGEAVERGPAPGGNQSIADDDLH